MTGARSRGSPGARRSFLYAALAVTAAVGAVLAFRTGTGRPVPLGIVVYGAVTGSTYSLLAVGLVLVHRSNRVINFALAEIGIFGAVLFENLVRASGWPWLASLVVGVLAAGLLAGLLERTIAQRFFTAPRLILSVVTIGIAQLVAFGEYAVGLGFGTFPASAGLRTPLSSWRFHVSGVVLDGNALLLLAALPAAVMLLGSFLRRSRHGIATRAASENLDRAAELGIPVRRLSTIAWVIAGLLAGLAIILRSPVVGLVSGASLLGPTLLLRALTAAVAARFESIGVAAVAGLAIGALEQALYYAYGGSTISDVVFVVLIVVSLLVQRRAPERSDELSSSSWKLIDEERPVPSRLARLAPVRAARVATALIVAGAAVGIPAALPSSSVFLASDIAILAVVAVSLVVLTGWSGQISLGQLGLAALGAAATARLTADLHWDFLLALLLGGLAGAAASVLLGAAAFRIRGFFFAVTSLGFAVAVETFFLNARFFPWLVPVNRPERPVLLSRFDLGGELAFYYFSLAVLALVVLSVVTLRRTRTGRALIAMRDNDRAARSFGVRRATTQLMGFAIAGFLAGIAGGMLAAHDHALTTSTYSPIASITVFAMVVIGGLGSIPGAIAGAVVVQGAVFLLPPEWSQLATGAGLLLVLLLLPGGLGRALYSIRDLLVARAARHRGLAPAVPRRDAGGPASIRPAPEVPVGSPAG